MVSVLQLALPDTNWSIWLYGSRGMSYFACFSQYLHGIFALVWDMQQCFTCSYLTSFLCALVIHRVKPRSLIVNFLVTNKESHQSCQNNCAGIALKDYKVKNLLKELKRPHWVKRVGWNTKNYLRKKKTEAEFLVNERIFLQRKWFGPAWIKYHVLDFK